MKRRKSKTKRTNYVCLIGLQLSCKFLQSERNPISQSIRFLHVVGCLWQFLWVDRTGVYPVPQSEVDERWLDFQWHVQHIPRRFDEVITSLGDTCQIQTHNCIKAPRRSNSRWSLRKDEARSVSSLVRVRPSSKSRGESSIRKKANSRRSYKRKCSIEEIWRGDVRKTTSLSLKLLWYYCLPKKNLVRMKYFP